MKRDGGFVYLIGWTEDGPTKIGVAQHIGKRLETLQGGCPYKLRAFWAVRCVNAYVLEDALLKEFRGCALAGEWVGLPAADVSKRALALAKSLGLYVEKIDLRRRFPDPTGKAELRRRAAAVAEHRYLTA